jgi:NAD(P)-dependent dehydrogenase (short-subunit alcohol dehydrogenase family)
LLQRLSPERRAVLVRISLCDRTIQETAGILGAPAGTPALSATAADLRATYETNVSGVVTVTRTMLPLLAASRAAQVLMGLRRRDPELGKQWPMLIAGGLSFLVGIFYNVQALGDDPSLSALATYATGGGVFFIVQAGLLAWRTRRLRTRTA